MTRLEGVRHVVGNLAGVSQRGELGLLAVKDPGDARSGLAPRGVGGTEREVGAVEARPRRPESM